MSKRKIDDDSDLEIAVKLYGAPPRLSEDLVRRLQDAVSAARQERASTAKRSINPFFDSAPFPSALAAHPATESDGLADEDQS